MTDNDKSPRFDDPKNITVGRARVIYVRAIRGFDRPIQPEGWILPGGKCTQSEV